jgi:hypothetical protein
MDDRLMEAALLVAINFALGFFGKCFLIGMWSIA